MKKFVVIVMAIALASTMVLAAETKVAASTTAEVPVSTTETVKVVKVKKVRKAKKAKVAAVVATVVVTPVAAK